MSRKLFFPILVVFLVISACNLQSATPTVTPVVATVPSNASTGTPIPSDTPLTAPTMAVTNTPGAPAPTASPQGAGLTLDMLKNATYTTPFYNRTITLINGSYSEGSGATLFSVMMLGVDAFGDLNGDGKNDAAVILSENGGGSGSFESVVAVVDLNGAPHQVSAAQLGDRVLINSVDISSGVIHLDMVVQGPTDPMCCPSVPQKQNYWLLGNKLWLMRLSSTIGGTEHLINVDSPALWASVANPFTVVGSVTVLPFENTLATHIYLVDGTKVNDSNLTVAPTTGTAGTFSQVFNLSSAGITDWVIIQFVDVSAADGSTIALGSIILKAH